MQRSPCLRLSPKEPLRTDKDGQAVVDLWGENTETETTRPPAMNALGLPKYSTAPAEGYDGDTLQIVYSSTKAMAATVFALAADRGLLAYDDKVAKHSVTKKATRHGTGQGGHKQDPVLRQQGVSPNCYGRNLKCW